MMSDGDNAFTAKKEPSSVSSERVNCTVLYQEVILLPPTITGIFINLPRSNRRYG